MMARQTLEGQVADYWRWLREKTERGMEKEPWLDCEFDGRPGQEEVRM